VGHELELNSDHGHLLGLRVHHDQSQVVVVLSIQEEVGQSNQVAALSYQKAVPRVLWVSVVDHLGLHLELEVVPCCQSQAYPV
jgi:hypothetical protein